MTALQREYKRLRKQGWHASVALDYARTAEEWDALEYGEVQLIIELDDEYPDSLCADDAERANDEGVWGIVGQYRDPATDRWETADSVWGFIGDDWRGSGYDYDVKRVTLDAWARAYKPLARVLVAEGVGL